jgi:putative oxidoreductase
LNKISKYYSFIDEISKPLGRLLVAQVFLILGYQKVIYYDDTVGWMESMGISGSFLPFVIIVEIFGSLGLILGWKTRTCAILLCGYCLLTAVLFHVDFSVPMQQISFMKNIALSGGLLYIFANGAGKFSLDTRKKKFT